MQADYYNFHQVATPQTFAAFGSFPYGFTAAAPSIPFHRNLERLKKVKPKHQNGENSAKYDDATNNSTDESIHLVKTRKTGESAPNRFDSETSIKKRSQSGNSLMKGGSSAHIDEARRSHVRNQSEDRSLSPSELNELRQSPLNHISSETASAKGKNNKKRRDRKLRKGTWHYADDGTAYSYADNRVIEQTYLSGNAQLSAYQTGYMPQQSAYMQQVSAYGQIPGYSQPTLGYPQYPGQEIQYPDYASSAHVQYAMEQQQQHQQQQHYPQYQQYANPTGYDVSAPGGPLSTVDYAQYQQQQQQQQLPQYEASGYTQSYGYPQVDQSVLPTSTDYTSTVPVDYPSQSFGPVCEQQNYIPGLPPGAKIVAEYFLGYLDEPSQQQYTDQSGQSQYSQQQQQYQQYQQPQSSSESSKEDVDIEVWEKNKIIRDKEPIKSEIFYSDEEAPIVERPRERRKHSTNHQHQDDLKKLKDDIVKAIQKELGDLKLDPKSSEPVQPIFLMPKQSEQTQQKPIYIPRNIYVPVVRPVFVPRERIIVRPQIIHVARPVLVDRPVPIQQRPIVIERDRPVPVRVDSIDKNDVNLTAEGENVGDIIRNTEHAQEVTYHEFTQTNSSYPYGNEYEENRRKMEVMNLLAEEANERKKMSMESKSNDDLVAQYNKYMSSSGADVNARTLDSLIGNSQGYTLEVLDQRVSDKFERTDSETIKARYGVDSYQYMPSSGDQVKGSGSSYIINNNSSEYYPNSNSQNQGNQNLRASGSFKSISSAAELRNNNSSSNIFGNYGNDSNYGNITMQGMPSPGGNSRVATQTPNTMQKMVHTYGNSSYEQDN